MATWVLSIKHVFRTCTNGLQSANNGRCMVGHAVNVPELIEGKTYINNSGYPDSKLDFPGQIPTSPISSAFSGRYFSLAAPMCQLALPGQIPTSLSMKPMRWEFFMGYTCYSPNTCVTWTYPKSALTPISCVQTVAYSVKNHKPWECKNLMQVSFKWLIEPHEIGVWHLQRAKTILYFAHEIGNQKTGSSDNSYLTCR